MPRSFAIVAPDVRRVWLVPGLCLILGVIGIGLGMREDLRAALGLIAAAIAATVWVVSLRRRRVVLEHGELRIAAGINNHRVQIGALRLDKAGVVDLTQRTELRPSWRTFGTGMPGYQAGHYRLRGGGKAFVLVTDCRRVLALPERDGRMLLLSLEQPQALLDALRTAGAR